MSLVEPFLGQRIALVHDWLTGMRGGEKVLEELCLLFPDAHLYTLVHVPGSTSATIEAMDIRTSWVQRLPGSPARFRAYLPLFPAAIESFDLRGYDIVISCSHCIAKGVLPDPQALHMSYLFTPMRYVWDLQHEYQHPKRLGRLQRLLAPVAASHLRTWDAASHARVDQFLGCSRHVTRRIERYYGRDAEVLYPPVDTDFFTPAPTQRSYLLIVSALVPYKAIELAIDAVRDLDVELVIAGMGPERARLEAIASPRTRFVGSVSATELRDLYRGARAFLLPGEEDFGIAALEAQSVGTPVIAYGRGGALETVIDGTTGTLYAEPTPESLAKAIDLTLRTVFDPEALRANALRFSRTAFTRNFVDLLSQAVEAKADGRRPLARHSPPRDDEAR